MHPKFGMKFLGIVVTLQVVTPEEEKIATFLSKKNCQEY